MTIFLFADINYQRPPENNYEKALSTISHIFYLGGTRVTVVDKNQVRLEKGSVSYLTCVLKVASFAFLFFLTIPLLGVNFYLRYKHPFVPLPSSNLPLPVQPVPSTIPSQSQPLPPSQPQPPIQPISSSPPSQPKKDEEKHKLKESTSKTKFPPITTADYDKKFEDFICKLSSLDFRLLNIKISDECLPSFSSAKEMYQTIGKIVKQVHTEHLALQLNIPSSFAGKEREIAMNFINILEQIVDIQRTQFDDIFYILPQLLAEMHEEDKSIRYYENGVVEEVTSGSIGSSWANWEGRRIFPKNKNAPAGKTEQGTFTFFKHVG